MPWMPKNQKSWARNSTSRTVKKPELMPSSGRWMNSEMRSLG